MTCDLLSKLAYLAAGAFLGFFVPRAIGYRDPFEEAARLWIEWHPWPRKGGSDER